MARTIVIGVGNSDNKLTQLQWAEFVAEVGGIVEDHAGCVHFEGGSRCDAPWQNYCWVCEEIEESFFLDDLRGKLKDCRNKYKQDSVAMTIGETEFV